MKIAAILPHTLLFGGVKHYLEIGKTFLMRGHEFVIFCPDGTPPDWCAYAGEIRALDRFYDERFDAVFISEECFLEYLAKSNARVKLFYVINQNKALHRIARNKDVLFAVNSTRSYHWVHKRLKIKPYKAFCGVNTDEYFAREREPADRPLVVITYGRQSMKRKGTHLVVKACERLHGKGYDIKLLLFDTASTERLAADIRNFKSTCPHEFVVNHPVADNRLLYWRAGCFASAESKGTWANTASEAMACGVPVIASSVGSDDFLIHNVTGIKVSRTVRSVEKAIARLYHDAALRSRLSQAGSRHVRHYQWRFSADNLLALFARSDARSVSHSAWPFAPSCVAECFIARSQRTWHADENLKPALYIINYHSLFHKRDHGEWERWFDGGVTSVENFAAHMEWLCANATPVAVADIPQLFASGPLKRPHFAITFDDGYVTVARHASAIASRLGIKPALCLCSDFAEQKDIFCYVVLGALLNRDGFPAISRELRARFGIRAAKPKHIYRAIKVHPQYCDIAEWIQMQGKGLISEQVHLNIEEARGLAVRGWDIVNHTRDHAALSSLLLEEQTERIESCHRALCAHGLAPLPFLAVPFGGPAHVNQATQHWLCSNTGHYCMFANGGINRSLERTEILRMGIGDISQERLADALHEAALRTPGT